MEEDKKNKIRKLQDDELETVNGGCSDDDSETKCPNCGSTSFTVVTASTMGGGAKEYQCSQCQTVFSDYD